jgi:protein involved in polysaccharide export with SLBB domain
MKRLFLMILFFALMPLAMLAQTPQMMDMARAELQKRGLNETEVRTRLMENGIDVDNIPPTEYANYQSRVTEIINQMVAEKNAATITPAAAATGGVEVVSTPEEMPQTTTGEAAAEEALEKTLEENHVSPTAGSDIYGHSLFTGKGLDVFRTTDGALAPETYILGEGDEVHISIFGSSQTEIHQRIGPDGSIQPTGSSKIFLKGMTLAQGREAIRSKLSHSFSFRPDQIAVTISTARTVAVSIYGEVGVQGGFTISALNTVFNALAAAGGPTSLGSVRNIQLSRAGKTYTIDIYKYMKNPTIGVNYDIQNADVIFVPVAQKIVKIEGAVNRPMRYEMIDSENLADLIEYAGGVVWNVYPEYVQIERIENGQIIYQDYKLSEIMSGKRKVSLQAGDIIRIKVANEPVENYVSIEGDVYYNGRFELDKNTSLSVLLNNAKPRYTAKTDYLFVERTRDDETVEVITVPYPGTNGNPDFVLRARDKVTVLKQSTYRDVDIIEVSGQVRKPFSRNFSLDDKMTVSQAIDFAGGLKPTVFPVAYIFRKDVANPEKMQYIRVDLEADGDRLLQPGDRLNVYDNTLYTNIGEVRVSGAVKEPFGTTYDESLTLHDMLCMAGGFTIGAAYDRVEVFRLNISKTNEVDLDLITLQVDEDYNIIGRTFDLQPYDHIVVRMTPNYTTGRYIELNGRVKYPGVYVLEDSKTQLWDIIKKAGGLLDDADPYARLTRTQGRNTGSIGLNLTKAKRNRNSIKNDPILMEGDVINIVRQENTVVIRETGTRMAQYVPVEYSSTQKVIVYDGAHRAKWYIKHYAGGFTKTADKNSVTVTMPNNQAECTRRFLGIRRYPKVEPGGVITLRIDDKKKERIEKPKEKVDWGVEARNSLAALVSIVSIILLLNNLNK